MNIDNGKPIDNFNYIPEFYKEIINSWVEFGGGQAKIQKNLVLKLKFHLIPSNMQKYDLFIFKSWNFLRCKTIIFPKTQSIYAST